jgi:CubicO group peptidase (beta-lactamase class C family)
MRSPGDTGPREPSPGWTRRLYLHRGQWEGRQVLPAAWVDESTRRAADPAEEYQYLWWVNTRGSGRHHFYAHGKHGQFIYVMPERQMVFVRFGPTDPWRQWPAVFEQVARRLDALGADITPQ